MLVLRRVKPALRVAAVLCVALPASASGAVTIGSDLEGIPNSGHFGCAGGCTLAHDALPQSSLASGGLLAPSDGVVVRWRIKRGSALGTDPTPAALRITRPGNSATRISAGTGPTVIPAADQISTFDVRLPIQAGDTIGIDCCTGDEPLVAFGDTTGALTQAWLPRLIDGEPPRAGSSKEEEMFVNADIEPDADEDGFGDETQDQCPTDASTQGTCPPDTDPPKTRITKGAPNELDKGKVKFAFTSSEPDSTFECKLDKEKFKPCRSPKTVKRLDEGKHRFKVRAIDAAGNVDSSPAKDKFKVVG